MALQARIAALILAFCLGLGLAGFGVYRHMTARLASTEAQLDGAQAALAEAVRQRKLDAALLARRAQENAVAARETALLRQRLRDALAAHQEWATQPVPKEVQDALAQP
jgi:hypothetical protein